MGIVSQSLLLRISSLGITGLVLASPGQGNWCKDSFDEYSGDMTRVATDVRFHIENNKLRITAMFYDNAYALGHVFQSFLRDQPDVLDDLRDALCGKDPLGAGASDALISRFEQWLDKRGIEAHDDHRATLLQVAEAFVDLAAEPEEVDSLVLV
jgi:hypothetical protein